MAIKSRIHLLDGSVTSFHGDAIVNAANKYLRAGAGVCGAVFEAAGLSKLSKECEKYSPIKTGEAVLTDAYNLRPNVKAIIHAVGPIFESFEVSEPLLRSAYLNSLLQLIDHGYKTIAFPCISTGIYGYPLKQASETAIKTVYEFLKDHEDVEVYFYMWDMKQRKIYENLLLNLGAN